MSVSKKAVFNYLTEVHGLSVPHAEGILANIQAESAFNPTAIGDSGRSYGFFQFNGSRRSNLNRFADDPSNWQQQIDYALTENEGSTYANKKFSSGAEATAWWTKNFERPADSDYRAHERITKMLPRVRKAIYGTDAGDDYDYDTGATEKEQTTTQEEDAYEKEINDAIDDELEAMNEEDNTDEEEAAIEPSYAQADTGEQATPTSSQSPPAGQAGGQLPAAVMPEIAQYIAPQQPVNNPMLAALQQGQPIRPGGQPISGQTSINPIQRYLEIRNGGYI